MYYSTSTECDYGQGNESVGEWKRKNRRSRKLACLKKYIFTVDTTVQCYGRLKCGAERLQPSGEWNYTALEL